MKLTVDRILDGKFEYDRGNLDFSCSRIELSLRPGEEYTGSFEIQSASGKLTEGFLYSRNLRMTLLCDYFSGTGEEIGYTFSAKGLEEGDVIKGEIYVVSNRGEYALPYVVSISHSTVETSLGNVRNLFHFANLAKTNWDEAVKLFYSDDFVSLFRGSDKQFIRAYRGLSTYYGNEQNMEEFLLQINKKNPIEYILERNSIVIDEPVKIENVFIDITRNGWGYTFLNVTTDNDFVVLSSTSLTDSDFLGNYLHYQIEINPEKLHPGNNFATVKFFNSYVSVEVSVKVTGNLVSRQVISKEIEYKHALMDMITYYKAFRLKSISADTWIAETSRIVDRISVLKNNDRISKMYRAQLLITQDRFNEAKWLIDQVEDDFTEDEYLSPDRAYFLYLTTLINRQEAYIDRITEEVETIYNADPSQWRVAWLLLYLSEEYAISASKKWLFIENQLSIQCTSPVMYVEAANMLALNPSFLTKLEPVQVRVLTFMHKENLLTKDLVRQIVYLAGTGKWYSTALVKVLMACYDIIPDADTLSSLCGLLIAHNKTEPEYFQWYRLALEAEARVTQIYEFYMKSLDISIPMRLPKMVYLYFSYQNELDWEHTAYLYARVIENRNEQEDIFLSYKEQIERFVLSQISENHMNRDLAVIYRFVLNESVVSKEMADKLASLIFTHRLSIDNTNVSKVIVYQSRECVQEIFNIENGEAFVPLYNKDYTVLFEDNFSNRYMKSVNYDTEKLMVPGKLANVMLPYVSDNLAFDVYAVECSSEMVDINDENRVRYQRILDAIEIEPSYKTEIRTKLMQYYFDHDQIRELDSLLESLDMEEVIPSERIVAIRFMVIRGMYDKALAWIKEFGIEGIENNDLLKLVTKLISRSDFEPNDLVTDISAECFFKGKYDDVLLSYLCEHFNGMTKDMRQIFVAAENFSIDLTAICEKLIIQMLYTGYYIPQRMNIYKKYVECGANPKVRMAFLTQCCFDYFVKEQLMEGMIFSEIVKLWRQGEDNNMVCKLASAKYYSENLGEADADVKAVIKSFLDIAIAKGIYFPYFKEFMEQGMEEINRFADKTFIEYKTEPGKRVMIHYIIERGDDSKGEYITQEMRDMFCGVHVKSFVLFFGENLLYYITEESDGEEQLTESGSVSKSDIGRDISTSRFSEINDIVIAHTLQDYETTEALIYEYCRKEYMINKLFTLE